MARPKLSNISTSTLKAELQRRVGKHSDLVAERDALDKKIAELQGLDGQAPEAPQAAAKVGRKPGRKPKTVWAGSKPLAEYVREVLAAAPHGMGLKDIEAAVLAAGYPTRAASIYVPIKKVLPKIGTKKLGRGVYALRGKPGRKATKKEVTPGASAQAKAPRKRKTYAQTGDQMILGLLGGGKALTTAEINKAWKKEGRGGTADNMLNKMVKAGTLKREKLVEGRGSTYTVA
jgi:hypothetical protein